MGAIRSRRWALSSLAGWARPCTRVFPGALRTADIDIVNKIVHLTQQWCMLNNITEAKSDNTPMLQNARIRFNHIGRSSSSSTASK
ncbi:hypothetical protein B0H13DRAFT_966068 [Mycena leptocephala]|nr:hypothetical protein B0H13DRAFT_966068 [Mycena leptocephala]